MPRQINRVVVATLVAGAIAVGFAPCLVSQTPVTPSRSFTLTETVHIAAAGRAGELRLWLPMPHEESSQPAGNAKISGLQQWKMYIEPEYRNRYAYATLSEAELQRGATIKASFHVERFEHQAAIENESDVPSVAVSATMRLTQPDRLAPIDGEIAAIAQHQAGDAMLPVDKARRIYDYLLATMKYDGANGALGNGDALKALRAKSGDSADFAALFVALARSTGVPARFEAGFVLPPDAHEGDLKQEHAWALVHITGTGWVPIDAADGFESQDKRDFYFGGVDANRVKISAGRDIRFYPQQKAAPLNYFLKAYAELDGKPYAAITTEYSFKDDRNSGPVTTTANTK